MSENFRVQAKTVRVAAQSKLRELRERRMARRVAPVPEPAPDAGHAESASDAPDSPTMLGDEMADQSSVPEPEPQQTTSKKVQGAEPDPEADLQVSAAAVSLSSTASSDDELPRADAAPSDVAQSEVTVLDAETTPETAPLVIEEPDATDDAAPAIASRPKRKRPSREAEDVQTDTETDHASEMQLAEEPCIETEPCADTPAESDLKDLPGIGDGLLRLFQSCQVHSLHDLAQADCAALRKSMGLPGELLNLDAWIAEAKARI